MYHQENALPSISMFYGIVITMYNNGSEHNPPHFHARYGEFRAVFNLEGDLENGDFPAKQKHLVKAWALLHGEELLANWNLCVEQQQLYPIEPLR